MEKEYEPTLIEELKAIREMENHSSELEIIIRPEIVIGKKVLVNGGPLKGFSGIVSKRKNKTLVSVNLEILGQSVSAEIDIEFIETDED
jgi:transcription antitermination factor NusG